jgi:hydrogenase-4 component F
MIESLASISAGTEANSGSILLVSLLLTPIVSGFLVTILRRKRAIELVTVFSACLVLVQASALIVEIINEKSVSAFDGKPLYADAFSAVILLPIAGVGFVSSIYSVSYMSRQYDDGIVDDKHIVRYYQGFNAFLFTMLLVPVANNTGVMWVAIEATTLVSVLLIMLYVKENAIEAAWKYLMVATVGLAFALFGTVLFYYAAINSGAGGLSSSEQGMNWTDMLAGAKLLDPNLVKLAFIFLLVGYGTKAGLAPMHTWLPDAHSEAPTPVSALLSGVLLNCSIYAIIRFHIISTNAIGSAFSNQLLIILGVVSVGIAAASIYFQKDMKRMLAYSSVEHMGIISLAIGFGGFYGIYGAILHIINHAIAKPLMFFASGNISQRYSTKAMSEIRGIIRTMPVTGALFLIGGLAIVGIPPFNIFTSEFLVLSSGFASNQFLASGLVILFLVVIFASFMRHLVRMVFGNPKVEMKQDDMGKLAIIPMLILAAMTIILGFFIPQGLQTLAEDAMEMLK